MAKNDGPVHWRKAGCFKASSAQGFPALDAAIRDMPGVYRVIAPEPLNRVRGSSRVLYIGCARSLGKRLSPLHHVLARLYAMATQLGDPDFELQVAANDAMDVPPGVSEETWVRFLETALLNRYLEEHLELPPLNIKSEGFIAGRAMEAVAATLSSLKGLGIKAGLEPSDEPDHELVFLPLVLRRGQAPKSPMPQLFWTWPHEWLIDETIWWRTARLPGTGNRSAFSPDTVYLFAPDDSPLAHRDDLPLDSVIEIGGVDWVFAQLTEPDWRARTLAAADMKSLRAAITEPLDTLRRR